MAAMAACVWKGWGTTLSLSTRAACAPAPHPLPHPARSDLVCAAAGQQAGLAGGADGAAAAARAGAGACGRRPEPAKAEPPRPEAAAISLLPSRPAVQGAVWCPALHCMQGAQRPSTPNAHACPRAGAQVNTSGEESKYGVEPGGCTALARHIWEQCRHLRLAGLMTIGQPDYTSRPENFQVLSTGGAFLPVECYTAAKFVSNCNCEHPVTATLISQAAACFCAATSSVALNAAVAVSRAVSGGSVHGAWPAAGAAGAQHGHVRRL